MVRMRRRSRRAQENVLQMQLENGGVDVFHQLAPMISGLQARLKIGLIKLELARLFKCVRPQTR